MIYYLNKRAELQSNPIVQENLKYDIGKMRDGAKVSSIPTKVLKHNLKPN